MLGLDNFTGKRVCGCTILSSDLNLQAWVLDNDTDERTEPELYIPEHEEKVRHMRKSMHTVGSTIQPLDRKSPRLQWAGGHLVAFVAARDGSTSLAFYTLRFELLDLLVSASSLQPADVVAIEQIRQRVCSESSEAVKDILGIFKRLDQGFTPSYVKGHRVEWDNLKFEVGAHCIHSFLDLLLTSVENHFDAALQDAEVRAKFSNEITNLATQVLQAR